MDSGRPTELARVTQLALAFVVFEVGTAIERADAADATGCRSWVARVVAVQGQVEARQADEVQWRPVRLEQPLCGGDMVRVSTRSRAAVVLLVSGTTLQLDQRTTMTIPKEAPAAPRWLELLRGAANFLSRTPKDSVPQCAHLGNGVLGPRRRRRDRDPSVFRDRRRGEQSWERDTPRRGESSGDGLSSP